MLRVDSQRRQQRGVKIAEAGSLFGGDSFAVRIGCSMDISASKPTSGEQHAEARRPMIATGGDVDLRCPTELASADDERMIEQVSFAQVGEQGRKGGVERFQQFAMRFRGYSRACPNHRA